METDTGSLEIISQMDFSKHLVFSDGEEPFKIEFMTYISSVKLDDAFSEKVTGNLDGLEIPFISFNDLILSKMASNRTKDKLDVEELQKISKLKSKD